MAYGNYTGYGYGYPQYNTNMGYQQYQNPMMQNMVQPQQQTSEVPFSEMHFGTWINLWVQTIDDLFDPNDERAQIAKNRARHMGTFLHLNIFNSRQSSL